MLLEEPVEASSAVNYQPWHFGVQKLPLFIPEFHSQHDAEKSFQTLFSEGFIWLKVDFCPALCGV